MPGAMLGLGKIKMGESPLSPWERGRHVDRAGHDIFQVLTGGSPGGTAVVQRIEQSLLPEAGGEVNVMKKHWTPAMWHALC